MRETYYKNHNECNRVEVLVVALLEFISSLRTQSSKQKELSKQTQIGDKLTETQNFSISVVMSD